MEFDNSVSRVGFIGNYRSVDDVINFDSSELAKIGGSFEEIGDRIGDIVDYVEANGKGHMDDKVEILFYGLTKGPQFCPFSKCTTRAWNDVVTIQNPITKRKLTINRGIEHLVREHYLLEKRNDYGITAGEFYEHFMLYPKGIILIN